MKLSPRDRRAILFCVVAVGGIALVHSALLPWLDGWGEVRDGLAAADRQLHDAESKARRLSRQRRRLEEAYGPAAEAKLDDAEPARAKFMKAAVEGLGQAGLQVKSVQPAAPQPLREVPGASLISLEVQAAGQMPQLVKWLDGLRSAPTLTLVDRLGVTATPQAPGNLNLTFVLSTLAEGEPAR